MELNEPTLRNGMEKVLQYLPCLQHVQLAVQFSALPHYYQVNVVCNYTVEGCMQINLKLI